MRSLFHLKKCALIALAIAGCLVAFTGGASANSITLSQSPGCCGPSTYKTTSAVTVKVFANLMGIPTGGSGEIGQVGVFVSLTYDPAVITALDCAETPAGQTTGTGTSIGTWEPFTINCGGGSPADGGLFVPGVVLSIEQVLVVGDSATSGTLHLGTVTFHAATPTPTTIIFSALAPFPNGGILGDDFVNRNPGIPLGTVTLRIIPEPTTLALLGLGVLGLGLSGRRLRRR